MIKFYENIEAECDRIQKCIDRFGWTSDHNLDWFSVCAYRETGIPVFVEFDDGSGLLTHKYPDEWSIWSDPLSDKGLAVDKIIEFSSFALGGQIEETWCIDVSDNIYPELKRRGLNTGDIYYSLSWPVLNMNDYSASLPSGHFKDMRNAKNKFYREHEVVILDADKVSKADLLRIVDAWKENMIKNKKENAQDIYDLKYRNIISNDFKGFSTSRVLVVDGQATGINAGYKTQHHPGRFAGVVGLHDYSVRDLGTILWLEDLDWIKKAGYKELDMQGSEDDGGLKLKLRFGAKIERKTDAFAIKPTS